MSRMPELFLNAAYGFAWRLVRMLPTTLARALFQFGADRMAHRGGAGVCQLRKNLARVVPQANEAELEELVREGLRSYARYWCEVFRLPSMDHRALYHRFDSCMTGRENLDAAIAQGQGVIVALPHSGNFDVGGIWLMHHVGSFTTVVERLRPESLYRRFVAYRQSLGFEILPLTGGARSPSEVLMERLRDNQVVCLVSDRDLSRSGIPVTFFGEPARMPAGPAKLACATGAVLLPLGSWYTENGWACRIHPPIRVNDRAGVAAATQALADVFAGDIAAHPTDWHMLQKLWLADLPATSRTPLPDTLT
ncbi:MAG: phosphatidylinositol mannoside acyltransferase, partial [Candidatus Dormibacteraceae bacterium]